MTRIRTLPSILPAPFETWKEILLASSRTTLNTLKFTLLSKGWTSLVRSSYPLTTFSILRQTSFVTSFVI